MKESHKSSVCMDQTGAETRSDRLPRAGGSNRQRSSGPLSVGVADAISAVFCRSSGYCMAKVSVNVPPAPRTNRPLRLVDEMLIFKKP